MPPTPSQRGVTPAHLASTALVAGIVAHASGAPALALAGFLTAGFLQAFSVKLTLQRQQRDHRVPGASILSLGGIVIGSISLFAGLTFACLEFLTVALVAAEPAARISIAQLLTDDSAWRDRAIVATALGWGSWTYAAHSLACDERNPDAADA